MIDLFGARRLDDVAHIDATLKSCIAASGSVLLGLHVHHADASGGVAAMAVLPEGHVSIRTWPETAYAAVDVLMDDETKAQSCLDLIKMALETGTITVRSHRRGEADVADDRPAMPARPQRQRARIRRVA